MPGPGGGSRGGGGHGGGFHGGGHHGGGFHGGGHHGGGHGGFHGGGPRGGFHRPHFHRPYFHRPYFHRPYYGGGGGCLGGLLGMILVPIILICMIAVLTFSTVTGTVTTGNAQEGTVIYDEEALQDYADGQYARAFGSSTAYEDNLLLVFLTDDNNQGYCYIAWVGDHIQTDVNYLFGGNSSQLGYAMDNCINQANYKYSLDTNLAAVVSQMEKNIESLALESCFTCAEEHAQVKSCLINYTDLPMTADTVNAALDSFTQATGIPVVLVVEQMTAVFQVQTRTVNWSRAGIILLLLIVAVVLFVMAVKKGKKSADNGGSANKDKHYDPNGGYDHY